jgi:hypothetical protein
MRGMEPILDYLKRKLKDAGPKRWAAISAATGASVHTMRKVAYSDIENPGVLTMQPLLTFFQDVDAGRRELPPPAETAAQEAA